MCLRMYTILFLFLYVGGRAIKLEKCPVPNWSKIACEILTQCIETDCTRLQLDTMDFLDREIVGPIPTNIWAMMPKLETVLLGNNQFTGTIPQSLLELPNLKKLSVPNNLLSGNVSNIVLKSLEYLNLSNNTFFGSIKMKDLYTNLTLFEINNLKNVTVNLDGFPSMLEVLDLGSCDLSETSLETIGHATSVTALTLSHTQLQGTIPSGIGALKKHLDSIAFQGNNLIGTIPESFGELINLEFVDLSNNKLNGTIPSSIGENLKKLAVFNVAVNLLSGSLPVFKSPYMASLFLHLNRFSNVPSGMVEASEDNLIFLSLASQSSRTLVLEEGAFSGIKIRRAGANPYEPKPGARLVLANNRIEIIPAYLFGNNNTHSGSYIDLSYLGVNEVKDNAFAGLKDAYVNLNGNSITKILPSSFPMGSLNRERVGCRDIEGWYVNLSYGVDLSFALSCSNITRESSHQQGSPPCEHNETYPFCVPLAIGDPGVAGLSALQACCIFGGGDRRGLSITMSEFSDMYCIPSKSDSSEYAVECGCTISKSPRVDLQARECRSECPGGHYWIRAPNVSKKAFPTNEAGFCVQCQSGTYLPYSDGIWYTQCFSCSIGTYSDGAQATVCKECETETYAEYEGSSVCRECQFGRRTSGIGSDRCLPCGIMYYGSRHCKVPWLGFVIATAVPVLILVTVYFVYNRYRRIMKEFKQTEVTLQGSQALLEESVSDLRVLSDAMRIEEDEIEFHEMVAKGSFAKVYRATYGHRFEVAVKVILDSESSTTFNEKEINFLRRVRHRNVVRFFGSGQRVNTDNNLFIVFEYMDAGSLDSFLEKNIDISWNIRKSLVRDIVEGMVYLHTMSIHRDLKSGNVMLTCLDGVYRAKIADFGMSKRVTPSTSSSTNTNSVEKIDMTTSLLTSQTSSQTDDLVASLLTTQDVGTPEYMAPELIQCRENECNATGYTNKIDVYAFGIMLWEIRERQVPWRNECRGFTYKVFREVLRGNRPKIRLKVAPGEPSNFIDLMTQCWNQDPFKRPSFFKIKDGIQKSWTFDAIVVSSSSSPSSKEEGEEKKQETEDRDGV